MEDNPRFDIEYDPIPTIEKFHRSSYDIRCIVGPVGSGKTSGATWEGCHYIPLHLFKKYGIKSTRGVVVRNSYRELKDTTQKTIIEWFPWGDPKVGEETYTLKYPENDISVELMFRSCDSPEDMKKFKSLELTWYWIDESIEVSEEVKRMLKNRIGRYPPKCPVRYGIETTNAPDVEHPTYSQFDWTTDIPGPLPSMKPLKNHIGFWQPPFENSHNLRPGYYEDLISDYADNPEWIEMYILNKPGMMVRGKSVYNKFKRDIHVSKGELIWSKGKLFRGWDNSGNSLGCVVLQQPRVDHIQIIKEFHSEKMGTVDFGEWVATQCNMLYPDAEYDDYGDPAGENKYSTKEGGFTSNAQLMRELGINVIPSEQNWEARRESVERQLGKIDGILIDPGCTRLINGFIGGYVYPEIGTTGRYSDKPIKNKYSHIHDALQYVLVKLKQGTSAKGKGEWNITKRIAQKPKLGFMVR